MTQEPSKPSTILLVDDTPENIGVVLTALEQAGYHVAIATSGAKALQRAALILPDLILLDVIMPGMDGYETCRQLKAQDATREIPVIFLSALVETFDKLKGFALGAVDYFIKPIATEELLARVRTHVTIGQLERELRLANRSLEERVAARTLELKEANERYLREIEERKQAEESLRTERGMFVGGPTVVFKWKAKESWPVEYVSPNVADQFGFTPEELISGKVSYAGLVHPDDLARIGAEVAKYTKQGVDSFEQLYRIARSDGAYRWLQDFTTVIRDREGAITHFLGYVLDVTAQRQAEEELKHQLSELQRWHDVTLDREQRVEELKGEVNQLLERLGEPSRYVSQGSGRGRLDT